MTKAIDATLDLAESQAAEIERLKAQIEELNAEAKDIEESHADDRRMIDRIADIIGLPQDQELSTTAFELWSSEQTAEGDALTAQVAGLAAERDQFATTVVSVASERDRLKAALAKVDEVQNRKAFPILNGQGAKVDWQLVQDHGKQAKDNHDQTVQRLAERGGLAWAELYYVLTDQCFPFNNFIKNADAIEACRKIEARYLAAVRSSASNALEES